MAQAIYKFELALKGVQHIEMQDNAKVLSAQNQDGKIMVWALCDPAARKQPRTFYIMGTGGIFEGYLKDLRFIDTVQLNGYVWHVFEEI